jgi:hypothetical protein
MKKWAMLLVCAAMALGTYGCKEKTTEEKLKDAAEEASDKAKDATDDAKGALNDAMK